MDGDLMRPDAQTLQDDLSAHVAAVTGTVDNAAATILEIAARLVSCFEQGGKVLICGNGGSAADAQHFAAEFVNHLRFDRPPLPAIALTTDSSVLTSVANDRRYEDIFARQIDANGAAGDMLIVLSTSGTSPNVLAALAAGRRKGMVTVGLTGEAGIEPMGANADVLLAVPSRDTQRIQECHLFVYHVIAGLVEERLFGAAGSARTQRAGAN
jgi:D-sedoheptulose 7-phosphate isomerase